MLNELCQLADALERAGITPSIKYPKLNSLPNCTKKSPCYRISLSEKGKISSIDYLSDEIVSKLFKWEPNYGDSFPGFNIRAIYRVTDFEKKKKIVRWKDGKELVDIDLLKKWSSEFEDNWDYSVECKLQECLLNIPKRLLDIINSSKDPSETALNALVNRIIINASDRKWFRQEFENYLWDSILSGKSISLLLSLLVQEGDEKKEAKDDRKNISVYLDISDYHKYDNPIASEASMNILNSLLLGAKNLTNIKTELFDAFGGMMTPDDLEEVMPKVKIRYMKTPVITRAMAAAIPCQTRYGRIGSSSFPAGQNIRNRVSSALSWLSNPEFEDFTWGKTDESEYLFAYPEILPQIPVALASMFGTKKDTIRVEPRFVDCAKQSIRNLRLISSDTSKLRLHIFTLKKMDEARTKIVFHRNYTVMRLESSVHEWLKGCENIPTIHFRVWGEHEKPEIVCPVVPAPLQLSSCLNTYWKLNGTFVKTQKGDQNPLFPSATGLELLLEEHSEKKIPHLLNVLLINSKGLILYVCNQRLQLDDKNRETVFSVTDKKKYEHHKLLIPSILGLLLFKIGIKKEDYMSNAPFLVGRMLKLADELHALYCKEVRDNNMPPQLVGNALMTAALDSPVQSLAQLALRLKPYYGWAQTFHNGENVKLAGYFVGLYGETASQLAALELPQRFNDADRAQLLLGYLAANPKRTEKGNNIQNNESSELNKGEQK
jgi:hypothetical protein